MIYKKLCRIGNLYTILTEDIYSLFHLLSYCIFTKAKLKRIIKIMGIIDCDIIIVKCERKTYELKAEYRCSYQNYVFYDCIIKDYPRKTIICNNDDEWRILWTPYDYNQFDDTDVFKSDFSKLINCDGYFIIEE